MQELMIETLTKTHPDTFMSLSRLGLQMELLRAKWVQSRMKPRTRSPMQA